MYIPRPASPPPTRTTPSYYQKSQKHVSCAFDRLRRSIIQVIKSCVIRSEFNASPFFSLSSFSSQIFYTCPIPTCRSRAASPANSAVVPKVFSEGSTSTTSAPSPPSPEASPPVAAAEEADVEEEEANAARLASNCAMRDWLRWSSHLLVLLGSVGQRVCGRALNTYLFFFFSCFGETIQHTGILQGILHCCRTRKKPHQLQVASPKKRA